MLRDDPRLTAFADRELGPLFAYDAAHGTRLVGDLATYLEAGGYPGDAVTARPGACPAQRRRGHVHDGQALSVPGLAVAADRQQGDVQGGA